MKRLIRFWPVLIFVFIVCLTAHINYRYIGKYNYPLKYPFMNEEEFEEYQEEQWENLVPGEGLEGTEDKFG